MAMELDDTAQSQDVLDHSAALADLEVGAQASITVDGGLKKTVLQKGYSKDRPEAGDEVEVHYTGTLEDGTKFDSSRDRDEPFTFTLKEGSVIRGWDLGVGTMRKGEKAILTCSPDYGYGPSGSPPVIPPNATLNFEVELLSWKSTKDILGDGGVMKSVVTPGVGWDKPSDRDEVLVKFTAKVAEQPDAAPFASSPPEGTEFTVMDGLEGMNGVGRAVKTMKQEERANMIIQPQYAYGALGRDGVVPANTPVEVDLELVSWKRVEDIFGTNGAVSKKILSESREWKTPNEGTKVTLRLVGRLENGTVFDEYPQGSELVYITDDEVVCEGLDAAVMKMKKGERAEIIVRPPLSYPAGHKGNKAEVPPNAVLKYEAELVHYDAQKESFEMENEERVAAGDLWKEKGNKAYREGKIERAVRLYDKALSYVAYDKGFPEALRVKSGAIKKSASLNLAAAHLKQKDWREAIKNCDKALEADPNNTKALFRRAQAYMGEGDNVEAEQDVKKALLIAPGDPDLAALQKRLRACLKDESQKQKALYAKMFSKPLSKDEPQPPPQTPGENGGDNSGAGPMEGLQESDTLPPGTQPAPKGSVLLEQV